MWHHGVSELPSVCVDGLADTVHARAGVLFSEVHMKHEAVIAWREMHFLLVHDE
jgi:hypothetical protein